MGDLKTRLHNARVKLLRQKSSAAIPTQAADKGSITTTSLRRSASFITKPPSSHRNRRQTNGTSASEDDHPLAASLPNPLSSPENVARKRSSSTLADRQNFVLGGSLTSSKDLHSHSPGTIQETPSSRDTESDANSSVAVKSATEPPVVVLSQPSPPEYVPTPPALPAPIADMGSRIYAPTHSAYRKVWVKRPHATATLVKIKDDDLVDDVKDMILTKYGNSLGRSFDAPDVCIRIIPREAAQKAQDRTLGPDEEICRLIDAFYPGGQTIDEALVIDVPQRRTPKPSPRAHHGHHYYEGDTARPLENGTDYFPQMPVITPSAAALSAAAHDRHPDRAMTVVSTGHVPPLPSPGFRKRANRPHMARQHTSSPTALSTGSVVTNRPARIRHDSQGSEPRNGAVHAPPPPPLPTPPTTEAATTTVPTVPTPPVHPPARVSSPRSHKPSRRKKAAVADPAPPNDLLNGTVPPINVLIVEDNMINLRVLGAFMERLKVRWQSAIDGQKAVSEWRKGGFHLVLMDIQLPIMNGLDATREIRRLERINRIGAFSGLKPQLGPEEEAEIKEGDRLVDSSLFKSPVIIVALTASSLQSDRHEALAAGCNDFLTKPVNFLWLERKVKEWGCMQALIDFDGWRKWKDFHADSDSTRSRPNSSASGASAGGGGGGLGGAGGAGKGKGKESLLKKAIEGPGGTGVKREEGEGDKGKGKGKGKEREVNGSATGEESGSGSGVDSES